MFKSGPCKVYSQKMMIYTAWHSENVIFHNWNFPEWFFLSFINVNKNVYNTYSNVPYHLRSDIFESEQILVSNSVFVKNFPRFLEVFIPWIILSNGYSNNLFVIVFTCSIAFQRYQTWYGNNYLNLINSQAGQKKDKVL